MKLNLLLEKCRHDISVWLEKLAVDLEPGRFRFCLKGSKVPVQGHAAQVSTCFAMKIAWQTGIWEAWSRQRREACVEFVKSFQQPDGFFHDPWIAQNSTPGLKMIVSAIIGNVSWRYLFDHKEMILRAETRQSAATLLMVDEKLLFPLPYEVSSADEMVAFISSFDWSKPWSAGSHLSHLLMMLSINWAQFGKPENYYSLINAAMQELSKLRDPETGTWFSGNPSDTLKINGSMKVFSGLQWIEHDYQDNRKLIDLALAQPFEKEGCGFLNRLFVVQQALKGLPTGYRQDEIRSLAGAALKEVFKFKKPDGAFSFYANKCQTGYYLTKVSHGYPISDLHGTIMMTWAIAIALDLMGSAAPEGAEVWKWHKA